ncbi:CU044_2847 family protein [Streptomyces polyrhachis]|uniref:CU044_2847 family protein n=1 Tax=Streptomyces polyrhachis TaxID=1282885 RepID=A0ABW2GGI9_9ACTN
MPYEIRELELPDGQLILARVSLAQEAELPGEQSGGEGGAFQDVGARDRLAAWARQLDRLIAGVGRSVHAAALRSAPQEVSATFGVELVAKPGKAVAAVIADAEGKASISVTLTWRPGETCRPERRPPPGAQPHTPPVPAQPPRPAP